MNKLRYLISIGLLAVAGSALGASNCPPATLSNMMGIPAGEFPQQYNLDEYERLADCKLKFSANPKAGSMNKQIRGNPKMLPLEQRIPEDALVVVPYDSIGKYGGTFDMMSNATEAGTSDFLAIRHVNLVRFSDDLTAGNGTAISPS
jgi:peptide/nickel transport system substrate-binding protein